MAAIIVGGSAYKGLVKCNDAIAVLEYISTEDDCGTELTQRITELVAALPSDISIVLLMSAEVDVPSEAAVLEAMRLFEMHPFVGAVGGRIFDANGKISDVGLSFFLDVDGRPFDWRGLRRSDPGAFALALKPQIMRSISQRLFFVRRDLMLEIVRRGGVDSVVDFANSISESVCDFSFVCAYSPLIETQF